ncbi:right-handed parallel beta-helix repeat-containing protein [Streptomyces sp. NPDC001581]|uniref:right-handed parallel beta-helix repeat-containing protein n=1 Tax=Streptomyces sp. NPDC001581 TaxID=3154386 RepID=UPI0033197398
MNKLGLLASTAAALATTVVATPAADAHAQSIVLCSQAALRTAITQANAAPGPNTLLLAPGCTYTLTAPDNGPNGLPLITSDITITGSLLGTQNVIRRQSATDFRILAVEGPNGRLTLNNLTVRDGRAGAGGSEGGGGILAGTGTRLTLNSVEVTRNVAVATAPGGGVMSFGTLIVRNSTVSHNIATAYAGGIGSESSANISNTTVTGNSSREEGGGIAAAGSLTLTNSRVTDNGGRWRGGGLYANNLTGTVTDTLIRGNTAVADLPEGGGIATQGATTLTLERTTVFANRSLGDAGGGGISNGAASTMTLRNSSVTNNYATSAPGGISNSGAITLQATPVVDNVPSNCTPSVITGCTN